MSASGKSLELTATTSLPVQDGSRVWANLMERIDEFSLAWDEAVEPPELRSFLPAEPAMLRHLVLVELIKIDLEYRWQERNCPKTIEQYVAEFAELSADGPPCDLIYEEFQLRRRLPNAPSPEVYLARFPSHADQLRRLLKLGDTQNVSTRVSGRSRGPDMTLEAGQRIDDFDLLTKLGAGAFASVFLARQRSMQRLVALKVSRDKGTEPQTLAQLDHPHIVRVYDQRTLPERQLRLMFMQHIPGGTLQGVVARVRETPADQRSGKLLVDAIDQTLLDRGESRPVDSHNRRCLAAADWPTAVCWLGTRLASALGYAHERGVLHRDVKPANVLLDGDGNPKLADFNVSFSSKLDGSSPAAYFGGSLAYMSPEQLEASDADHPRQPDSLDGRSDVFSLAVMLWELLTGVRPYPDTAGNTWSATLKKLITQRQAGITAEERQRLPRNLPSGLEALLVRCLSAEPDQRPADAVEFARLLQLCLHPEAQRLLQPPRGSLIDTLRWWPAAAIIFAGLAANVVLSWFNLEFNARLVIEKLDPAVREMFFHAQVATVNAVAYSVGLAASIWWVWPNLRALRRIRRGDAVDVAALPSLRRRCLGFGDAVMWISIALWLVAGLSFPIWLHLAVGLEAANYTSFIPSMALCGMIAATLTFFLATFVMVHAFYPALLTAGAVDDRDLGQMHGLIRRSWRVFVPAVMAPLLAVVIATLHPAASVSPIYKTSILWLAVIGISSSALAFVLLRRIQADIAALAMALRPNSESRGMGQSDSFWTASH